MRVKDNPLKRIAPTIREKCLQGILGKDAKIECTTHNEFYLLQVSSKADADRLLKTNKLHITPDQTIDIEFAPHNQLNESKGVLFDRMNELEDMSTDEITAALNNYGVTRTDRLPTRNRNPNDRRKPGTTYFLTFLAETHPTSVKIGLDNFRVTEYRPRPRLCQNCLMFGHGTQKCRGKAKCRHCHDEHSSEACPTKDNPAPCSHCGNENHLAGDKECSKYKYETEVVTIMQRDHLLHYQARTKVNTYWNPTDNGAQSYANKAASTLPGSSTGAVGPALSQNHDASIKLQHENQRLREDMARMSQDMKDTVKRLNEAVEKLAMKENELAEERELRIDLQTRMENLENWASDRDQTPLMRLATPAEIAQEKQSTKTTNQSRPPPGSRRLSESKNATAPAAPAKGGSRNKFPGFTPGGAQAKRDAKQQQKQDALVTKTTTKKSEAPVPPSSREKRPAASPAGAASDSQEKKKMKAKNTHDHNGDKEAVENLESTLRRESSSSMDSIETVVATDNNITVKISDTGHTIYTNTNNGKAHTSV